MRSLVTASRFASVALAALMLQAGCDREPLEPVKDEPPTVPADDVPATVVPPSSYATTGSKVPEMTSYEVAIAIAAANRKKAEAGCESLPSAKRENCLSGVATDWNTTRTALDDLRGEQQ
jgi:hypothetical protein